MVEGFVFEKGSVGSGAVRFWALGYVGVVTFGPGSVRVELGDAAVVWDRDPDGVWSAHPVRGGVRSSEPKLFFPLSPETPGKVKFVFPSLRRLFVEVRDGCLCFDSEGFAESLVLAER